MKKLIIIVFLLLVFPVIGICEEKKKVYDPNAVYLGNDPTPHAKWALERDGYTIIYSLENLLKREEAEKKARIEEQQKQIMMEAQDRQERIQL